MDKNNIHSIGDAKKKQQQQAGEVSIDDVDIIKCKKEGCNCITFTPALKWGRLSAVHPVNTSGRTALVPFKTEACVACGTEMPKVD